ncbi:MAG: MarR family transcriptional regulator [Firmicutes bacterium]|nr:MarR family transcriptional regulator [Bacillota bacterium]MDH7495953.1 MarR family transcriptional regulator [Bacillota bacterium]
MDDLDYAVQMRELLRKLVRGIGLLDREDAECCGMTLSQCHALGEIAADEGLTVGELAGRLCVDPSAVTRITDALVQSGLLKRAGDPEDRRQVRLHLTAEGKALWEDTQRVMAERAGALARRIPVTERESVLTALERLVEALGDEGYLLRSWAKGGCQGGGERKGAEAGKGDPCSIRSRGEEV